MSSACTRRYLQEFGAALLAYMGVLVLSVNLLNAYPGAPWRVPVALAPMLPGLLMVLAVVRQLGRLDELQRRVQLEAMAFAFGGAAVVTFSYGFLENVGFPDLSWHFVWPIMAVLWLLGAAIA